ncbi:hypothetical protein MN116_008470 [Schistosoma mekongi]|uniref:Uncharacterized protein n=1 Tax=Schistosoma mekongi TaxID=38744 RepID=A0AAE1Z4V0_SCHME|nr:hypothetical protein MN116_008470 [Schistosoma mekongi]
MNLITLMNDKLQRNQYNNFLNKLMKVICIKNHQKQYKCTSDWLHGTPSISQYQDDLIQERSNNILSYCSNIPIQSLQHNSVNSYSRKCDVIKHVLGKPQTTMSNNFRNKMKVHHDSKNRMKNVLPVENKENVTICNVVLQELEHNSMDNDKRTREKFKDGLKVKHNGKDSLSKPTTELNVRKDRSTRNMATSVNKFNKQNDNDIKRVNIKQADKTKMKEKMTKKIVKETIDKSSRISHINDKNHLIIPEKVQNIQEDNKEGLNMDPVKSVEPPNTAVHSIEKIDITNVPLEKNTKENTEHPTNHLHYLKASHETESHLDPRDNEEQGIVYTSQNKLKNIIDPEVDNDGVYKLTKRTEKSGSQDHNAISVSDIKDEVEILPKGRCNLDINSSTIRNHDNKQRYEVKHTNDGAKVISKERCEVCSNCKLNRPLSLESSTDNASIHSTYNHPTISSDDYKYESRQSHCRECNIHTCEDNYRLFRRLMKSLRLHPRNCKHFVASKHLSSGECGYQRESCYCHYHNPSKQKYTNEVGFNDLKRHLSPRTIRLLQTLKRPSTLNSSSMKCIKRGSTYRMPSRDKLGMKLNDIDGCYRRTASHIPSIEYDDPLNLYNSTNIATQFHINPNNLQPWYSTIPLMFSQPRLIVRNIPIPVVLPNYTPLNQSIYSHQLPATNSFLHPTYHTSNTLQQIPYIPSYYPYP